MKLEIKVSSSRSRMEWLDINEPFSQCIDEMEEYSFRAFISVYKNRTLVAEAHGILFDEDKILNEHQNIVNIADMFDGDSEGAMAALIKSKIYKQELDEDLIFVPPYVCYLERVYVNPEHRVNGIGKYIFRNLYEIFLHCLNIHTRCFVIYPKPQRPDEHGNWGNYPDEDGSMKKLMINVIKKAGYKQIGKSGYYAINCMI